MEDAIIENQAARTDSRADPGGGNWIDAIVLLTMLGSGVFAFMRGFVKEAFVLMSWVLAVWATIKLFPVLQPYVKQQISSVTGANITTSLIIFCGVLVALLPFTNYIIGKVASTGLTSLDKSLGFVFGVMRGLLVVSLLYLVAAQFFWDGDRDMPKSVMAARTRPLLETGAGLIGDLIPEKSRKRLAQAEEEAAAGRSAGNDRAARIQRAQDILRNLTRPESDAERNQPAYDDRDRSRLDDIIGGERQEQAH